MDSTPTINIYDTPSESRHLNTAIRRAAQSVAGRSPSSRAHSPAASPVADSNPSRRVRANVPLPRPEPIASARVAPLRSAPAAAPKVSRLEPQARVPKAAPAPLPAPKLAPVRTPAPVQNPRGAIRPLFRDHAVRHASASEEMDKMFRVTRPMNWLILSAVSGLIAAAVSWALFGTISTRVGGQGILIKPGGVDTVAATSAGQITRLRVAPGDHVHQGQVIAEMNDATVDGALPPLRLIHAAADGRVLQVLVKPGAQVAVGTPLMTVEAGDDARAPLQALLYVPLADATRIRNQMAVHLSPSDFHKEEFGYVLGRVKSIGEFPVTRQEAESALGNPQLVDSLLDQGPMLAVLVDLLPDPASPSGYKWSSGAGPKGTLTRGTLCSARVTVQKQHPVELIVPGLKQATGLADNPS